MPAESNNGSQGSQNPQGAEPQGQETTQEPTLDSFKVYDAEGGFTGYSKSDAAYKFYGHNEQAAWTVANSQGILSGEPTEENLELARIHFAGTFAFREILRQHTGIQEDDEDKK